ncbi:hypothetical protein BKP56_01350 [Marinilactibacillus sp. 15R]|uniref:Prolow-density lipoprotein receptor-related protein 1-like beta-propeller domain-containing protein n=1 Tax=Marinilactibacillus piezotolerans TaxID=258723 RepID=A0A1I3XS54_9LACT|nr:MULTISPECIES: DUF5050 domain-containing protein [Marinilactibacillus]API88058.1 hypothetical protein BKP56_01350 [Marinilactibacillus sp. 15R]SFK22159.1 protein of unknown function [Marinilactibacillus piezotolerans]
MKLFKDWSHIVLKSTVFLVIPIALLMHFYYGIRFLEADALQWIVYLLYILLIYRWTIDIYRKIQKKVEVQSFSGLEQLITKYKWKVIERRVHRLIVRPRFDFPFNKLFNGKVEVIYANQQVTMIGQKYYVDILKKNLQGKNSFANGKIVTGLKIAFVLFILAAPVLQGRNLVWEWKVYQHNAAAESMSTVSGLDHNGLGNTVENTNNYGYAVENEDHVFYVEDSLNLVRTNQLFEQKTYLSEQTQGIGIDELNIVGEWLYYTRGEELIRSRFDGSEREIIYNLSYSSDIHIYENWIYFINFNEDSALYKMDLNGGQLQKMMDGEIQDLALYGEFLYVSHQNEAGQSVVERMTLDGQYTDVVLEASARALVKREDEYYYVGENDRLYRNQLNSSTHPELIIDERVAYYTIHENQLYYSPYQAEMGHEGKGIYQTDLSGAEPARKLSEDTIEGLFKIKSALLYNAVNEQSGESTVQQLDTETGESKTL